MNQYQLSGLKVTCWTLSEKIRTEDWRQALHLLNWDDITDISHMASSFSDHITGVFQFLSLHFILYTKLHSHCKENNNSKENAVLI